MKRIYLMLLICIAATILTLPSMATDKCTEQILKSYPQWTETEMSGKLKMEGLPLGINPSLKAYMLKDSLIIISVRAPLMGEVARVEIDSNRALLVNKYNNRYTIVEMSRVSSLSGLNVGNIQDLLMGRIFYAGADTSTPDMFDTVQKDNMTAILPRKQAKSYSYGFVMDGLNRLICSMFCMNSDVLQMDYSYPSDDAYTALLQLTSGKNKYEATLMIEKINYKPKKIEPIKLSSKYKEVSPRQLF